MDRTWLDSQVLLHRRQRSAAKSALQGRGTVAPAQWWWGHEVLKGPNTLAGYGSTVLESCSETCGYEDRAPAGHPAVVHRTCKISAIADAPTTVLRTVPRPSQGGLLTVQPILLYCCCPSFLQSIGYRRCPHHRAPHGPPPLQGGLLTVQPILLYCCCPSFLQSIGCRRCPHHRAPHGPPPLPGRTLAGNGSYCSQLLHSFPDYPIDVLCHSGKISHHIPVGIPQDQESQPFQVPGPFSIGLPILFLIMLSTVQFDDHLSPFTAEIHNILSDDDLPFHPYRIFPEKVEPKVPFLFCHVFPHLMRKVFQVIRDFVPASQSQHSLKLY